VFLTRLCSVCAISALAACQSTGMLNSSLALAPSNYEPEPSSAMPTGHAQTVPAGFISFCLRTPDQCGTTADQAAVVTLDADTWAKLLKANDAVNTNVRPLDDLPHHGRAEYWTLVVDGYGDCEDSALTKRKALIEAGLPAGALRVATALTPRGNRHAVLTVATDRGDYVLDNLNAYIVPWSQTGYTWIARQDAQNAWNWSAVGSESGAGTVAATH
jgi:predicted transglutaminase-like cysteine proteinase